jgi:hypothetical protein
MFPLVRRSPETTALGTIWYRVGGRREKYPLSSGACALSEQGVRALGDAAPHEGPTVMPLGEEGRERGVLVDPDARTYVNGERLGTGIRILAHGDALAVRGGAAFRFTCPPATRVTSAPLPPRRTPLVDEEGTGIMETIRAGWPEAAYWGLGFWDLRHPRGVDVLGCFGANYLVMRASFDSGSRAARSERCVRANARFLGGWKVVCSPGDEEPYLRMEVPFTRMPATVSVAWLRSLHAGLGAAFRGVHERTARVSPEETRIRVPKGPEPPARAFRDALRAGGWWVAPSKDDEVLVLVETRGGAAGVRVGVRGKRWIRAWCFLRPVSGWSPRSREAVALLLLRAGYAVPFVRGRFTVSETAGTVAGFAADVPRRVGSFGVDAAVRAVAHAAHLCLAEVAALRDEGLAARYLGEA